MPESAQDKHAQCLACRQAIVGDSPQPQLSLDIPVVKNRLHTGTRLLMKIELIY